MSDTKQPAMSPMPAAESAPGTLEERVAFLEVAVSKLVRVVSAAQQQAKAEQRAQESRPLIQIARN